MSAATTDVAREHVHAGLPLVQTGAPLPRARAAAILVHGRGGSAADILNLAAELDVDGVAYLAPQAAGNTWYPLSFLAPIEANEPGLSSALRRVGEVVHVVEQAGVPAERIMLAGFSQGACLTLEHVARNARRYGAVAGFTGGLIGPPGAARDYPGGLAGTPVFLGSSVPDPHVPWERVEESAVVLERMGAVVDLRGYPYMPHTINAEEVGAARALLERIAASGGEPRT
jgi:glyoxalase family protein